MRAQVLSIGDEILGGYISDTNSTFLAQQLALLNIDVSLVTHVGDDRNRIAEVIKRALTDADIVVCTGGVGPTEDDLTREAIAQVMGETPTVDQGLLSIIKAFFTGRGLEMPERNQKQAWLIPSSDPLPNSVGTAPGWFVRRKRQVIVAMPGVPREMFRMWAEQVMPRLATMRVDRVVRSTTIKTIGIGESLVEQHLHDLVQKADPVVATYAKDDGVHIRITAVAETDLVAESKRDVCVTEIKSRIGPFIYGEDEESLAGALLRMLAANQLTLAIADAGGGGRFASLLAANPAAAGCLVGSRMTPMGASSSSASLADSAIRDTGADLGVGISAVYEDLGRSSYAASIEVTVAGARLGSEAFPIRTVYEDIQRRSALFAAEVLRSALVTG